MSTPPDSPTPPLFDSLTPALQRVTIAKDVLRQLDSKRIIAEQGCFLRLPKGVIDASAGLRQVIADQQDPCPVCALGSLLVAQVDVNGDCQLSDLKVQRHAMSRYGTHVSVMERDSGYENQFAPYLLKHFTPEQLQLIEVAFEHGAGAFSVKDEVGTWREGLGEDDYEEAARSCECDLTVEQADKAMTFGALHREPDARLRAIMTNVITNGGTFIP